MLVNLLVKLARKNPRLKGGHGAWANPDVVRSWNRIARAAVGTDTR